MPLLFRWRKHVVVACSWLGHGTFGSYCCHVWPWFDHAQHEANWTLHGGSLLVVSLRQCLIHKWKHGCCQRASVPCWVMGLGVPSVAMHDLAPLCLRAYSRAFFRLIGLSLCLLLTGFVGPGGLSIHRSGQKGLKQCTDLFWMLAVVRRSHALRVMLLGVIPWC